MLNRPQRLFLSGKKQLTALLLKRHQSPNHWQPIRQQQEHPLSEENLKTQRLRHLGFCLIQLPINTYTHILFRTHGSAHPPTQAHIAGLQICINPAYRHNNSSFKVAQFDDVQNTFYFLQATAGLASVMWTVRRMQTISHDYFFLTSTFPTLKEKTSPHLRKPQPDKTLSQCSLDIFRALGPNRALLADRIRGGKSAQKRYLSECMGSFNLNMMR